MPNRLKSGKLDEPLRRSNMKPSDQYHKWVEWSEEDQTYIGKCPDLITGIHGDDPRQVYAELSEVVDDVVRHFESAGRPLPPPTCSGVL
jgi:predicted RNase H-like HicB family nuclease